MFEPIQQIYEQIPVFVLVLFRIGGIIAVGPLMGMPSVPSRVKLMLAMVLSMAVFPMINKVVWMPNTWMAVSMGVAGEVLIGITMGFVVSITFTGIQLGAEIVSQQMGLSMARMVDPSSGVSTTVLSQFYLLLATAIYVLINGHLILLKALIQTFETIPLLSGHDRQTVVDMMVAMLTEAFRLGIRLAGPALVAIFLATLAMGFISRTMPQLNILAAGFPVRIVLAMILVIASLGTVCLVLEDSLMMAFDRIGQVIVLVDNRIAN